MNVSRIDRTDGNAAQPGVPPDVAAYLAEAKVLFDQIHPLWSTAGNVWRTACAFDSLLDYFIVSGADSAPYGQDALTALDPTKKGNWWDDFGWIGIAALRAAEQRFAPQYRYEFLKIAINAWCYMYGPGWSTSSTQNGVYPYTDQPGWAEFARTHTFNLGAPNCWKNIKLTWPEVSPTTQAELGPRYTPGGIWNSPFSATDHPDAVGQYQGTGDTLNPIQNTVTNAVYALLSLRLSLAAQNPDFAHYFTDVGINLPALNQAWKNQIDWWQQWMQATPEPMQTLLLSAQSGSKGGSLVRERVSTFQVVDGVRYWDSSYNQGMTWSGDQGLLIGALREAQSMYPSSPPSVVSLYPALIQGVFANYFLPRSYGSVSGSFPLPWLSVGSSAPYIEVPPGNDYGDYQTGVGVFMRYLLQAYRADPKLLAPYRDTLIALANALVAPGFGTSSPGGLCDAFTAYGNGNADMISAPVNRLAVLNLAIAIS